MAKIIAYMGESFLKTSKGVAESVPAIAFYIAAAKTGFLREFQNKIRIGSVIDHFGFPDSFLNVVRFPGGGVMKNAMEAFYLFFLQVGSLPLTHAQTPKNYSWMSNSYYNELCQEERKGYAQ